MPPSPLSTPLTCLLTFRAHGTWFPGDGRGWVDRNHRMPGQSYRAASPGLELWNRQRLAPGSPMRFCPRRRGIIYETVRTVCAYRGNVLHAINVRTNHVHLVLTAEGSPGIVMNHLKAYCTRQLVVQGAVEPGAKVWARHGSTRYLWTQQAIEAACRYVVEGQGEKLDGVGPLPNGRGSD